MRKLFDFFSSLKLTVVCLILGMVLVLIGTLAQADEGLYQAQERYFKHWIVVGSTLFGHKVPLILPGGYLVGSVLLVNLLAAHFKRFKFTWSKLGIFMVHFGLILLLLGQLLTDVLSTESAIRFSEGEAKNYSQDFSKNELVVIDVTNPQSDEVVAIPESMIDKKQTVRHETLPFSLQIKDYWVNAEVDDAPPADAKPAGATAGMWTNSVVVALPPAESGQSRSALLVEVVEKTGSLGTFLVTSSPREEQGFEAGGRKLMLNLMFAPMAGGNNLVISDRAAGPDGMVAIPENELTPNTEINRPNLPVTLRVKQFWPNSRVFHQPTAKTVRPEITQGILQGVMVTPMPPVTVSDNRNLPAAVVEVMTPQGSLGTFLLSCELRAKQEFVFQNRTYQLAMRFKRHYKPYSVQLVEVKHDVYRGTDIPKNFSSRVRIQRPSSGEDREVLIRMNEPLRYGGETFYQYQVGADERDSHIGTSTLQVVRNPGWLTPYASCTLMTLGLMWQFVSHLVGFVKKRRTV